MFSAKRDSHVAGSTFPVNSLFRAGRRVYVARNSRQRQNLRSIKSLSLDKFPVSFPDNLCERRKVGRTTGREGRPTRFHSARDSPSCFATRLGLRNRNTLYIGQGRYRSPGITPNRTRGNDSPRRSSRALASNAGIDLPGLGDTPRFSSNQIEFKSSALLLKGNHGWKCRQAYACGQGANFSAQHQDRKAQQQVSGASDLRVVTAT